MTQPQSTTARRARPVIILCLLALLAVTGFGCGRKGELQPPDPDAAWPRQYPADTGPAGS